MNIGVYGPELDSDRVGAPEYCLQQTIPHLRNHASVTLITHERKNHPLYEEQHIIPRSFDRFNREINKAEFDMVYFCGFAHRDIPLLLSSPTVLAYHGDIQWVEPYLNYGDDPTRASRRERMIEITKLCQYDHVIYVSNDVRNRTENRYSRLAPPSTVVYNGLDHELYQPTFSDCVLDKYGIEQPYVFHLSNFSRKKNPDRLIRAFDEAANYNDVNFVIAGGGWKDSTMIDKLMNETKIEDQALVLGYVPEDDLPSLYAGAEVFVFPSLHESFGLPVIESMACSTPVITANSYAIPEIAGSAVIYCDNTSIKSIANSIEYILKCDDVRKRYTVAGKQRASGFSWDLRAEKLYDIFKMIV